jgi:squalene-hopene/tetraprenyl-beta-curcumene cyclase
MNANNLKIRPQYTRRRFLTIAATGAFAAGSGLAAHSAQDVILTNARVSVNRGLDYLRHIQEKNGSWGEYPATTALALAAFLRNGKTEVKETAVASGVQFLLRQARPNGAIYDPRDPARALPNYNTALAIMALSLTKNPAYKSVIQKAQKYLEQSQFDEGEGIDSANPVYGGIGYGSDPDDHPDLSNLSMALQSLKESGLPSSAPVFQKAIVFLQRVQNRREGNDQAWAKTGPDDGGFVYDSTGESKAKGNGAHSSMGAMTYAGLESYIYCGISKDDPRARAAWNWIRSHYTVAEHPGEGDTSLYYYYHAMAKTLNVYGQKSVKDNKGAAHDWSHDLAARLIGLQHPDGSWFNTNSRYWENQPSLVTSYSLIALSYCLK